jgi:phosphatidate cytidylyltransferase
VAAVVYFGGWALFGALLIVGLIAGYEYLRLMQPQAAVPEYAITLALVTLLIADGILWNALLLRAGLLVGCLALLSVQALRGSIQRAVERWAFTTAGAIYVGLALSYFLRLRGLDAGLYWLIIALLGTWSSDTGAYFLGSATGKHKLAPRVSPNKSWEGVIGGIIAGVVVVGVLGLVLLDLSLWLGAALGVLLTAVGTVGDLSESVIKRQVGVKDSSHLIPGHGGMLDRIDSLLFVVPLVYYFAIAIGA